jgi:hypothetical protein
MQERAALEWFGEPSYRYPDPVKPQPVGLHPMQHFCRYAGRSISCDGREYRGGASLSSPDNCLRRSVLATDTSGLGCPSARISRLHSRSCRAIQSTHDGRLHSVSFSWFNSDYGVVVGLASGCATQMNRQFAPPIPNATEPRDKTRRVRLVWSYCGETTVSSIIPVC